MWSRFLWERLSKAKSSWSTQGANSSQSLRRTFGNLFESIQDKVLLFAYCTHRIEPARCWDWQETLPSIWGAECQKKPYEKLSGNRVSESTESIRAHVQAAHDIQNKRFTNGKATDVVCNADMRIGEIRQFCQLQDEDQSLMRAAMSQLNLSARAYHRILKLARTRADLAGSEEIQSAHLAEALQYRPKIMMG